MRIASNRICDIERFAYSELQEVYSADEIRNLLRIIFEEYLGWDLTTWLLSKQKTINQSDLLKINFAIKNLKRHRPIQHIIGKANFCGMTLAVTSPHSAWFTPAAPTGAATRACSVSNGS